MTQWIDNPDALRARIATPPDSIGLDTEFIRERTYWPQLALVQIALGEGDGDILLVDPLVPGMCAVSYTHLDVYKRQPFRHCPHNWRQRARPYPSAPAKWPRRCRGCRR